MAVAFRAAERADSPQGSALTRAQFKQGEDGKMSKRLLIAALATVCVLAFSAMIASGASAAATGYTAGSGTAIPAGESTGLALDSLTNQVFTMEQFGAEIVFTATGIDCVNCMVENHASPMDVTGTGGRLLYTGVTVNVPNCSLEAPGKGAGTITTEPLKTTASSPTSAAIAPVTGTAFGVLHFVGASCPIKGTYTVEGSSVNATVGGDVLAYNSTEELTVNGEPLTLTGEGTITAGITGAEYHPVELKESGASPTATAYTAGSGTAIPAGESTGIRLDQLSDWVLTTEQFGAEVVLTGFGGIDCENCMGENQASPMDVTGTGGRLLYTGVTVNIPGCTVEDPAKEAHTMTTEPLKFTAADPGSATISPVTGTTFAVIHIVGAKCPIPGTYTVEGNSVTASISGALLGVNSTADLTVNEEPATLSGEATITAGVTGAAYHPVEIKES